MEGTFSVHLPNTKAHARLVSAQSIATGATRLPALAAQMYSTPNTHSFGRDQFSIGWRGALLASSEPTGAILAQREVAISDQSTQPDLLIEFRASLPCATYPF
jgi:hypothetical protein